MSDENPVEDRKLWPWYWWLLLPFAKLMQKIFRN